MLRGLSLCIGLLVLLSGAAMAQQDEQITLHCAAYFVGWGFESQILLRNTTGSQIGVTPAFCFDGEHLVPYTIIYVPAHGSAVLSADEFFDTSMCVQPSIGLEVTYQGEPGAIMASTMMLFYGPPSLSFQVPLWPLLC